jgi:hypothetical protein
MKDCTNNEMILKHLNFKKFMNVVFWIMASYLVDKYYWLEGTASVFKAPKYTA